MPNLSVVVPVYNTEKYLDECIGSILNQSYKDIELILIDDGSTDKSGEICEKYKNQDKRVTVAHTANRGMIMARREGVMLAKSPYVTFVDSDDYVNEYSYECAVKDMNTEIDIICFGYREYWENGEELNNTPYFPTGIYERNEIEKIIYPSLIWPLRRNINPSLWSKIIKRKFLVEQYEKIKDLYIDYCEDAITFYPICKKIRNISIRNEIFYNYRRTVTTGDRYYILDDAFYDKLYKVYSYLKQEFSDEPIIKPQVDKHYICGVNSKKINLDCWNIQEEDTKEKIKSYETIILYGAGKVAKRVIPYLSDIGIDKFIVSVTKAGDDEHIFGNEVLSINEIVCDKSKTVVLLAVALRNQPEIVKTLKNMGYGNVTSVV